MTTKTMSVVEEVYRWLESNPEFTVFCCKKVHNKLPWLDRNHVSSALSLFAKEGGLNIIGVTGSSRANVYERTKLFLIERRFTKSKKFANRIVKPGYKVPFDEAREALPVLDEDGRPVKPTKVAPKPKITNRNLLLKRLYDLAERQLEIATDIEELREFIKTELIL